MTENAKQLDEFAKNFFKEVKLQFKTTDINVIGSLVELPVNEQLVKICLLFTRMYVDRFHKEIDKDSLLIGLNKMKKNFNVGDVLHVIASKTQYNNAIDDVIDLIK